MLFNSLAFLYAFLPITYVVFWRLTGKMPRYVWLAISGYVFYSFWNYKFCSLMLFSTTVSYLAGRGLLRWRGREAHIHKTFGVTCPGESDEVARVAQR